MYSGHYNARMDPVSALPDDPGCASPVAAPPAAPGPPQANRRRGLALHWQILIGLVLGAALGLAAKSVWPPAADGTPDARLAWITGNIAYPLGQLFLNLIFMVVLPLVFTALVLGIAELGDVRRLGRVGLRTLAYTVLLSSASVLIGVGLTNALRPGAHLSDEQRAVLRARYAGGSTDKIVAQAREAKPLRDTLLDLIPRNLLGEMAAALDPKGSAGGGMLAVMFFALLFGIALTVARERAGPVLGVLQGIYDAVMVMIGWAMRLAPLGVAGLMFRLTAELGLDVFWILGWYMATVLAGLALHFFGVYGFVLAVFARLNPLRFFGRISDAILTAFATSSSNATLPTALRVSAEAGIHREIGNFVLTVGATANQNGTALYEGVTVLFLAQVFGYDLSLVQQFTVVLMAILGGIGTAGVPGGSLPFIVVILQYVGLPPELIFLIIGPDRLLDMCRTTLNVTGDITIAACVDRGERRALARAGA